MNIFSDITTSRLPDNRNKYLVWGTWPQPRGERRPLDLPMRYVCSDQDPGGLWRAPAGSTLWAWGHSAFRCCAPPSTLAGRPCAGACSRAHQAASRLGDTTVDTRSETTKFRVGESTADWRTR